MRITLKSLIPQAYDFEPLTFGDHLLRRRIFLGLEQKEVAAILGVNTNTILNWEKGYNRPVIRYLAQLITFIGYDPESPNPQTIAEHLVAKRREHGWTQRVAAKRWGVDPGTWLRWENGGTIMLVEHRTMIADFIGLPISQIHKSMKQQWNKLHGKFTI
jgi:transcriptional regulator with XRE-family HTH domain